MTQEEKELLIKDLCSRLPYECIVSVAEGGIDGIQWTDATLNSYLLNQIIFDHRTDMDGEHLIQLHLALEVKKGMYNN